VTAIITWVIALIVGMIFGLSGVAVGFYLRREGISRKLQEAEEMAARQALEKIGK